VQVSLNAAVKLSAESAWPTPTARDFRSGKTGPATWAKTNARPLNEVAFAAGTGEAGGALSPEWVTALMGFPPGWLDVTPTPTDGPPVAAKRSTKGSPRAQRRVSRSEPQG
jgi:hypothetical protein